MNTLLCNRPTLAKDVNNQFQTTRNLCTLGANDPKSGLSNLSTDMSAAVTQSRRDNVVLEAGAGWVLGLGFGAGF